MVSTRIMRLSVIFLLTFALSACVASALVGNAQSRLLWAFLKPIVGFNPHEFNVLESSLVKPRMQALLGSKYDTTMRFLSTANELQQEGALFYIASRYAPDSVKNITDKAAFVWNADTNQMAVLLIENGLPSVFSESAETAIGTQAPQWPRELKSALDDANRYQDSLKERIQEKAIDSASNALGLDHIKDPLKAMTTGQSIDEIVEREIKQQGEKVKSTPQQMLAVPVEIQPDPDTSGPKPTVAPAQKKESKMKKNDSVPENRKLSSKEIRERELLDALERDMLTIDD